MEITMTLSMKYLNVWMRIVAVFAGTRSGTTAKPQPVADLNGHLQRDIGIGESREASAES
jgi:hypothetical protein